MKLSDGANDNVRSLNLLPGVPEALVRSCYERGDGNEIDSGKIFSPQSSSALVANTFGWFMECPHLLPPLPGLEECWFDVRSVDLERCIRLPWSRARHPNLDAVVETGMHLIGIESKRCEPFRGHKKPEFSAAFDRNVWGDQMGPYLDLRDQLRSGSIRYRYLEAAQLVKHAFALFLEGTRKSKLPVLYYLIHEPLMVAGRRIRLEELEAHCLEVYDFIDRVDGAQVAFFWSGYTEWLSEWDEGEVAVRRHGERVLRYLVLSEVGRARSVE